MSSTHAWSFTRLWAMIFAAWFVAAGCAVATGAGRGDEPSVFRMLPLAIALVPAFLTGSWAGSHREIRDWSLIRLVAMWVVCIAGFGAANDLHAGWPGAALLSTPVAILTIRWLELRREPRLLAPVNNVDPVRLATPPAGSPAAPTS